MSTKNEENHGKPLRELLVQLKNNDPTLTSLNLTYYSLTDDIVENLAESIKGNTHLIQEQEYEYSLGELLSAVAPSL